MKYFLHLLIAGILATAAQTGAFAQKKFETATLHVTGVCGMCEKRIETAALVKGVRLAEWDKNAQALKVTYRTSKTDKGTILRAVAAAGHDNELMVAPDAAYQELPDCCAYREGVEVH